MKAMKPHAVAHIIVRKGNKQVAKIRVHSLDTGHVQRVAKSVARNTRWMRDKFGIGTYTLDFSEIDNARRTELSTIGKLLEGIKKRGCAAARDLLEACELQLLGDERQSQIWMRRRIA